MTQIAVFAGMIDGQASFRYEHPFTVHGNRKSVERYSRLAPDEDGRLRHERYTMPRHPVVFVNRKTGLPTTVQSVTEAAPADTRQGRRARARFNKKWTRIHG